MPAPTALQRKPEILAGEIEVDKSAPQESITTQEQQSTDIEITTEAPQQTVDDVDQIPEDEDISMQLDSESRPHFAPIDENTPESLTNNPKTLTTKITNRKVPIPPHRLTPLKAAWPKIYPPLVEHLHLQVRMNTKSRCVELRTSRYTTATDALQKGEDFLRAFTLGFDVDDAIALLRLDDLYIETFEIKDVKTLQGEHLGRAIGRIAGKDGKTKFAIENTSRTRVVLADSKVHILGGFQNIRIAREAVVSLILGAPPGKVYGNLRTVAGRMKERF